MKTCTNKQCYQRVQFTLNGFPIQSPSKMWCTSQTLTHPAICLSSEALIAGIWWHVNNTNAVCVAADSGKCVCPWTVTVRGRAIFSLTREWKQNTQNPFCHTARTNSRACGASTCSHLSRVIMGRSARIRTYTHTHTRWKKQLTREPTNHASSNFNRRH